MGAAIGQMAASGGMSGVGQALVDSSPILRALQNVGQGVGTAAQTPNFPTVGAAGVGTPGPVSPDGSTAVDTSGLEPNPLSGILNDPAQRARLPAGMRNNNPGNIKFTSTSAFPGVTGPSVNTDQGDPQAVFSSPEAGMAAMHTLLANKYNGGKTTPDQIIAGSMGWTPGNHEAAANVARYMGIGPNDDINFNDPTRAGQFMRALMMQEHGNASKLYTDQMIASAVKADPATFKTAINSGSAQGMQVADANPQQQSLLNEMNQKSAQAQNGQMANPSTTVALAQPSTTERVLGGLFSGSKRGAMQLPQVAPTPTQPAVDTGAQDVAQNSQIAMNRVTQGAMPLTPRRPAMIQTKAQQLKAQV